jgi:DNA primase
MLVSEFLSRDVELGSAASGLIGHYPFHDDQHPGLEINKKGNYWHFFAGCGGGAILDFWMHWRHCDFKTAVKELTELLL